MTIWYSNITNAFFDDTITTDLPPDIISIDSEVYTELRANAQTNNLLILPDENGNPYVSNVSTLQPIRTITSYAFVNRLTPTERGIITVAAWQAMTASPPDPTLTIFLDDLGAATQIELDHPVLDAALSLMANVGLLSTDRVATIVEDGTPDESP